MTMSIRLLALAGTLWIGIAGQVTLARTPDTAADPATRAAAIVRKMTRAEKLQYVHGYFPPYQKPRPAADGQRGRPCARGAAARYSRFA